MTQVQLANPGIDADIRAFVESAYARQIDFLRELMKVPSDNPSGDCASYAAHAKALLETLGLTVEVHAVPQAQVCAVGMVSATNLIAHHTFGSGGPVVAMDAHGDVIPPGLDWTHDPYGGETVETEHGPTMLGRGVAVPKSDFATYTWAPFVLVETEKRGTKLNDTVKLHFTYDEETGGDIGPEWLLDQGLSKLDYAISAGFAYGITSAHNGCLHVEVTVCGKQAHAAMSHTGIGAIEAAMHTLQVVYVYRVEFATRISSVSGTDRATLNVRLIQGGINTNAVPDLVTFRVDRRMIPEEAGRDAEGELRAVIEHATTERSGTEVAVERILLAQPFAELPGMDALIGALRRNASAVFGGDVLVHGVSLYTDTWHYTMHGVPTVLYGAGPRTLMEACGHNTDENLRLNDLWGATVVVGCVVGELLGG